MDLNCTDRVKQATRPKGAGRETQGGRHKRNFGEISESVLHADTETPVSSPSKRGHAQEPSRPIWCACVCVSTIYSSLTTFSGWWSLLSAMEAPISLRPSSVL